MPYLISPDEAAAHPGHPLFIDATSYLPTEPYSARARFLAEHVPCARLAELERFCQQDGPFPHKLERSVERLVEAARELGVSRDRPVIVYDQIGLRSAPRLWWILRALGHPDVRVLDGGLPAWRASGLPVEAGPPDRGRGDFSPSDQPLSLATREDVAQAQERGIQVIDARSRDRFLGVGTEPRPGMAGGHIPHSLNLPYDTLIDPSTGRMLPTEALRSQVEKQGIDLARPLIATCGSGVSACVLLLAFSQLAEPDARLFDGSWIEWQAGLDNQKESKHG